MYTSVLKRAIRTGNIVLDTMGQHYVPVVKSWRLNERMYGDLQGRNKKKRSKNMAQNRFLYGVGRTQRLHH
eukprot:UN24050